METVSRITTILEDSFRANLYTINHFRMIGLIDVRITFSQTTEKVTLAFYSSSGTNNGKIKGLWYPIVGIKTVRGPFVEFTPVLNSILSHTTSHGRASTGWLAKSLFFSFDDLEPTQLPGFAGKPFYQDLLRVGQLLRSLYSNGKFTVSSTLNAPNLNALLTAQVTYSGNQFTQRENFENYMTQIYRASQ